MEETRVIRLRPGLLRQLADNDRTLVLSMDDLRDPREISAEVAFFAHFNEIRTLVHGYNRLGVVVVAVDAHGVAGTLCLGAKSSRLNTAVIGRHGACDLFLDHDMAMSLRHLVLLLHPSPDGVVRYRVLDLRTGAGMAGEDGERVAALECEGPAFVHCGGCVLFFMPVPPQRPWPMVAQEAWDGLPPRSYVAAVELPPERIVSRRRARRRTGDDTMVEILPGPERVRRGLLDDGEPPAGELRITSEHGEVVLSLGHRQLRRGLLLGRYDRCDTHGLRVLSSDAISRVHILVIELLGEVYVVDLASTNGLLLDESEVRSGRMTPESTACLGHSSATLRWRYVH